MKAPADGWDDDERAAIDELRDELETLRARHGDDPEIAVLRAARHAVLPPDAQEAADDRLLNDAWSRALVDGLDGVEPSLDKHAEDQLLARIRRDGQLAQKDHQSGRRRWTWYRPALASAALVVVAAAAWIAFRGPTSAPVEGPIPRERPPAETSRAAATPPPVWQVPLDKPDVTLSLAALTWRGGGSSGSGSRGGSGGDNQLLADLKEPLDAFRNNDYAGADPAFAALESRYPNAVEVFFYGGVSRLFVNDPRRAITALTKAADLADTTFAPRAAWYLAIAEERAGHLSRARARLDALCRGTSDRAAPACAAVTRIDASAPPPAR